MRRYLLLAAFGVGSAVVFTMGGASSAQADNGPHMSSAQLAGTANIQIANAGATKCANCHRAHTAKAEKLLLQAQPALCYTCHSAGLGADTDVGAGVNTTDGKALRGGGFNTARIASGLAEKSMGPLDPATGRIATTGQIVPVLATSVPLAPTTSKHNANGGVGDAGTIWGNGAIGASAGKTGVLLECGSCHDPHGNGNYRILKAVPVDAANIVTPAVPAVLDDPLTTTVNEAVAAIPAVMDITTGIKMPDAGGKVYTTENYWDVRDPNVPKPGASVDPLVPDGFIANVSQWCSTCHTRYLAGTDSYKTALTNPTTGAVDPTFTFRHRSQRTDKGGVSRPNCIQCHVSHGSNAAMGSTSAAVTDPSGLVTPGVGANSRLLRVNNRGTCVMCHNV